MTADKESLEQSIDTLQVTVDSLNDKLEEAKERERLIVEYPDINGPVNKDLTGIYDFKEVLPCALALKHHCFVSDCFMTVFTIKFDV